MPRTPAGDERAMLHVNRADEACLQQHAGRRSCGDRAAGGGTPDTRHPTFPRTTGGEPLKPRGGVARTMDVDGHEYEIAEFEGEAVAEAYAHDPGRLPHMYGAKLQEMFPRAHAAPALEEYGIDEDQTLLQRGLEIGEESHWKA